MHALRFASKVFGVIVVVIAVLLILRASFGYATWAGFVALGAIVIALYMTAHRWVVWLPGLLIFGVLNSLISLITHHAPTNPHVVVSVGLAGILLTFYGVGCVLSYYYDPATLSILDRCAWLLYLACMILPAFSAEESHGAVTPTILAELAIGMVAIVISFAIHHIQRGKKPARAQVEIAPHS